MNRMEKRAELQQVLIAARKLLENPDHHLVGGFAQDAQGRSCQNRHAVRRDIHSALSHASAQAGGGTYLDAATHLERFAHGAGYSNLTACNDAGHVAIIKLLDKGIRDLEVSTCQ